MVGDGVAGIWRDLHLLATEDGPIGWLVIASLVLLPVLAIGLSLAGSRLAIASVVIFVGVLAVWFLYYATDWWANPGLAGTVLPTLALLIAWAVLPVAVWRLRRVRRHRRLAR
jgi:hypothetical protein